MKSSVMNCPHCGAAISFGNKVCTCCGTATPQPPANKTFWQQWGCCIVVLAVIGILAALLVPAVQNARESARRSQCSCHIGCGNGFPLINYHDLHGHFPPAYTVDEDGNPLHSWRVLILPFIEQGELYEKIRLDEPWNSEHNRQFHEVQIRSFQCPSRNRSRWASRYNNDYSVIVGEGTIFPGGGKTTSRDDLRGQASQTILVVERATPINWMDPTNEIQIEIALKGINRHPDGIGSEHPGGANILRADYTRFFESQTIEDNVLRDLLLLPPKPDEDE